MSSYINFYLVNEKTKQYIAIDNFSRSNLIYRLADENGAPYERGIKLDLIYNTMLEDILDGIESDKNCILDYETTIKIIADMRGDVAERLETIRDYQDYIADSNDSLKELQHCRQWLNFLLELDCRNEDWSVWCGIEWYPKEEEEYDCMGL